MAEIHIPRESSLVVAATGSLTPSADYVCDGTADEVQINAAITALGATGGEVVLLEGTFTVVASITLASNVTLRGQGRGTIITTATDNLDIITAIGSSGSELSNIILRDLLVRGFLTGNKNDIGIHWDYVDRSKIINVYVDNNGEHGILLEHCDCSEIEAVNSYSNNQRGISINNCVWFKVVNAHCFANVMIGVNVDNSEYTHLTDVTCDWNDYEGNAHSGIKIYSSDEVIITGCHCDGNGLHGLEILRSDHCSVTGGQYNRSYTGDGINITGDGTENSDYNVVTGVVCTGNADDGIAIEGTTDANKNIVTSNQLLGNSGTALVDNGTDTEIGHNITV